jgi:hypothetical protein
MAKRYSRSTRHQMVRRMRDDVFVSRHFGLALVYLIPSLIWTLVKLAFNLLKLFYSLLRLAYLGVRSVFSQPRRS